MLRNPQCLRWSYYPLRQSISVVKSINWSPPPSPSIKWNVDASYDPAKGKAAIGGVLRDCNGVFQCVFSAPIPPIEINSAEVFAIKRAIQISSSCNFLQTKTIIIKSDSANAVQWCNAPSDGPWNLAFHLNYIRNALQHCPSLSIIHKCRESNMIADALAKRGILRSDEFLAWL